MTQFKPKHFLINILSAMAFFSATTVYSQENNGHPKTPVMGWSIWNNFRVAIDENIIRAQADIMASTKLREAGYTFVNLDDGFFGGRDDKGLLLAHPKRFPSGMKSLADYIHSKGLKAGIYSDAGLNTCASIWDKDTVGVGCGLFGNDEKDLKLMLGTWGYDFIKIDWCGGEKLGLSEENRYSQIGKLINKINSKVLYICRWQFPGEWAIPIADSWRISGDIANNFESIVHIIDKNADLWKYSSPGHFNDMDMLQVGRGMSKEEDRSHFTMWCILNSPLLLGNDLRTMKKETLDLVTNKEIIALNQDQFGYQARRIQKTGDLEVWAKPLISSISGQVAVVLFNRSDKPAFITLDIAVAGIAVDKPFTVRDLWEHKDLAPVKGGKRNFEVAPHGVTALKITGRSKPFNIYQAVN